MFKSLAMNHLCVVLFAGFLLQLIISIYAESQVFGEMATITYKNPKYIKEFVLVSKRNSRSSRYVTKMNGTLLHGWGNNVTARVLIVDGASKKTVVSMDIKICEGLKIPFIATILGNNTDLPVKKCPVPAGSYHFHDFVFRLSDLPFPVLSGDFTVSAVTFITRTKERISEIVFRLRVR